VIDGTTLVGIVQCVARLESELSPVVAVPRAGPRESHLRHDHRHRLVEHFDLDHGAFGRLDPGAPRVAILANVFFEFLADLLAQRRLRIQQFGERRTFLAKFGQLLLHLQGLEPGQLAQTQLQDVVRLPFA